MFALRVLVLSLSPLLLAACVTSEEDRPSLQVVKDVDLHRYLGTWYEIASIPTYFQRGCIATKATYSLRKDGRIQVENECRRKTVDGDIQRAVGTAWVAGNGRETAKLRCSSSGRSAATTGSSIWTRTTVMQWSGIRLATTCGFCLARRPYLRTSMPRYFRRSRVKGTTQVSCSRLRSLCRLLPRCRRGRGGDLARTEVFRYLMTGRIKRRVTTRGLCFN